MYATVTLNFKQIKKIKNLKLKKSLTYKLQFTVLQLGISMQLGLQFSGKIFINYKGSH